MYEPREDTFLLLEVVESLDLRGRDVLDMGTGSGEIALACARKGARVVAVDIDPEAVEHTRRRARDEGLEIDVRLSDLFEKVPERFDYIFFNAPYLPVDDSPEWGGLHVIPRFLEEVCYHLKPGGRAYIVYSSLFPVRARVVRKRRFFFEEIYVGEIECP